jgi:hypothetical protein
VPDASIATGLALLVRVAREAPNDLTRGRAWVRLGKVFLRSGDPADDADGLRCQERALDLGVLEAHEELAYAYHRGGPDRPAEPLRAFAAAEPPPQASVAGLTDERVLANCAVVQAWALDADERLRSAEHLTRVRERLRVAATRAAGRRQASLVQLRAKLEQLTPVR